MAQYHNKTNRSQHFKKETKKLADLKHTETKTKRDNKIKEKHDNKEFRRKVEKKYPKNPEKSLNKQTESCVVMSSSDFNKLIMEVPVKFNIFGKLTKNSKQLVFNLILKNSFWLDYNVEFYSPNVIKLKVDDIWKYVNSISKRKYNLKDYKKDCMKHQCFVYKEKTPSRTMWYYGINLGKAFENHVFVRHENFGSIPVFMELDTMVYANVTDDGISYPDGCKVGFYNIAGGIKYIPEKDHTDMYRVYIHDKDKIDAYREDASIFFKGQDKNFFDSVVIKKIKLN